MGENVFALLILCVLTVPPTFGAVAAYAASRNNRSLPAYFFLGFFLTVFGVFMAMRSRNEKRERVARKPREKLDR